MDYKKDSDYIKNAIEAILFMSPKAVNRTKIYSTLKGLDKSQIDIAISDLINDYEKRNTSIQIVEDSKKLEMVIKPEYSSFNIFATGTNLTKPELKTLAYISLNQPIAQSKITSKRPYEHIPKLIDLNLIETTKNKRKHILKTTKKFDVLFQSKFKAKKSNK